MKCAEYKDGICHRSLTIAKQRFDIEQLIVLRCAKWVNFPQRFKPPTSNLKPAQSRPNTISVANCQQNTRAVYQEQRRSRNVS